MQILVCIKQVPAKSVSMDGDGVLKRTESGGKLNPWDLYAIEAALRIAEATGGIVTALTMGPKSAEEVLRTAFSMGVDSGVLLSDKAFAGADVYVTAYTLAAGIRALGTFDLVLCGQQTTDGDTAQLPFSLAAQLGIPAIGWIKSIDEITETVLTLSQELTFGTQRVEITAPALLAVGAGIGRVRMPSLRDKLKAKSKEIRLLTLANLAEPNPAKYGLHASPTNVVRTKATEHPGKHSPEVLSASDAAKRICDALSAVKGGENT